MNLATLGFVEHCQPHFSPWLTTHRPISYINHQTMCLDSVSSPPHEQEPIHNEQSTWNGSHAPLSSEASHDVLDLFLMSVIPECPTPRYSCTGSALQNSSKQLAFHWTCKCCTAIHAPDSQGSALYSAVHCAALNAYMRTSVHMYILNVIDELVLEEASSDNAMLRALLPAET